MATQSRRLVLHIGRFKTGSSALQRWLSENETWLGERGYLYPKAGRLKAWPFAHHELWYELTRTGAFPQDFLEEIETTEADLIVSCENLSELPFCDPSWFEYVATVFSGFQIEIVTFLRQPSAWMKSWYREMVMRGEIEKQTQSFSTFLTYEVSKLDDTKILDPWKTYFPDATLRLLSYEKARETGVVDAFLDAIGEAVDDIPTQAPTENVTLSDSFMRFLREIRPVFGEDQAAYNEVLEATWRLHNTIDKGDPLVVLTDDDKAALRDADDKHAAYLATYL